MKHIVIVDDDRINLDCATMALGDKYKITTLGSGKQAVQTIPGDVPDLLLLDVSMPFVDGFSVAEQLRADPRTKDLPIVFLTVEIDMEMQEKMRAAGALDYILKPFVPSAFSDKIEEILLSLGGTNASQAPVVDSARRDPLTGLLHGDFVTDAVMQKMGAEPKGALLVMDIDNFKRVNEIYGTAAGDRTLQAFADVLLRYTDRDDIACRLGGDVFLAYIAGLVDQNSLTARLGSLVKEFTEMMEKEGLQSATSVSVGVALAPFDAVDFGRLYNCADKALYFAKKNGKHSYQFFSQESLASGNELQNLASLNEIVKSSDMHKGVFQMDFRGFQYVYNFIRRQVERGYIEARTMLLTLMPDQGYLPDNNELQKAIEILDQAIYTTLRRGDVATRYSARQVIVILPETSEEDSKTVVGRIATEYEKQQRGGNILLYYETAELK